RAGALLVTALMLGSPSLVCARPHTLSDVREIDQIRGKPSARVFRKSVRYVTRWRVDRTRERTAYLAGLQEGRRVALAMLQRRQQVALLPPAGQRRPNGGRGPAKPKPAVVAQHRQNLQVAF